MTGVAARRFLPAGEARTRLSAMLRVLVILAVFFGVLANAAHVEAHASGQHGHDAVEAAHHAHEHDDDRDVDGPDADDARPAKADHKADHAAGHSHVVGDRSSVLEVGPRAYAGGDARYRLPPDLTLPSAPRAPLLEPPSA